jgi:ATP-dependent Zn protease
MGAERKSMVISNEEKRVTAYHEAGHTLVGLKVPKRGSGSQGHDHSARYGAWA